MSHLLNQIIPVGGIRINCLTPIHSRKLQLNTQEEGS